MSFADELRKAEKRMKAQLEQEAAKKKRSKVVTKSSPQGGARTTVVSTSWQREDDIIAFYLAASGASKFFKENYSKKRKVAVRTMERQIVAFGHLLKNRNSSDITDQMRSVHAEFGSFDVKDLQKVVIAILRGEYNKVDLGTVIRR